MTIFDIKGASEVIQSTSESKPYHQTTINKTTSEMGKIPTTFKMGKILRTEITREMILIEKRSVLKNNERNKQRAKNQLFASDQSNSNDGNKTKTKNKDNGLSKIPINI